MRDLLRLWRAPRAAVRAVLGMNRRNLDYVLPRNPRRHFDLANDKLRAKEVLSAAGVPVAPTLATFSSFHELKHLDERLGPLDEFVVKPARGHGGMGILVIAGRDGDRVRTAGGRLLGPDELRRHIADIVFGVYTFDRADVAIVEPRLVPAPFFAALYPDGLSDVRVITVDGHPAAAMIRVPTRASDGRANLHQGALGVAVDLDTGRIPRAWHRGAPCDTHPDTGAPLVGQVVPHWPDILTISRRAAAAVPLGYLGIDLIVDATRGPMLLEINARPGLEIQNVVGHGFRDRFRALGVPPEGAPWDTLPGGTPPRSPQPAPPRPAGGPP